MIFIQIAVLLVDILFAVLNPIKKIAFIAAYFRRTKLASAGDRKTLAKIYFILSLITIQLLKLLLTYLLRPSDFTKTVLFDYFYLSHLPPEFNLAIAPVLAMIAYYYWVGHFEVEGNGTMQLAYRVLLEGEHSCFLQTETTEVTGRNVLAMIKASALHFLNAQQVFIVVLDIFIVSCQLRLYALITADQSTTYLHDGVWGLFLMFLMQFNALTLYIWIYTFIYIAEMAATLSVVVTEIVFIRFRQASRLISPQGRISFKSPCLKVQKHNSSGYFDLHRFFAFHAHNLSVVLVFNRLYSKLLLAYIVSNVPLSALIISRLIRAPAVTLHNLFLGTILLGQFAALFGNHLMAALYPKRIHQAREPLTRLSFRLQSERSGEDRNSSSENSFHLGTRLKLANYIAKLSTDNQYGISFLQSSLVTLATFFKLLYAILAYEMVKMIIFNFLPCSKGTQVIWFDYFTFAGMPENFNLTFAVMYYQFYYFYQVCYFQSYLNGSTVTMYKVLVLKQVRPVFLSTKYQGKYEVTAFVRRLYLAILNYQQVNVISLVAFAVKSQLNILQFISQNPEALQTFSSILLAEVNALLFFISLGAFAHIANLSVTIGVTTVLLHFILLSQIKQLLFFSGNLISRRSSTFTTAVTRKFISHQTSALLQVLAFDRLFGSLLFAYILANCPLNALACSLLIQGRLEGANSKGDLKGNLVQFVIGQFIPFFAVHVMAAKYSRKLHTPTLRVLSLNVQNRMRLSGSSNSSIRDQHQVMRFVEHFHTTSPYGITYAGMGLVTMVTFAKFCMYYHQFLMYIYMIEF
ncbi:hypothetical protein TYRP_021292 [Tyrophagus putrescentiae]|nr:hypothetical protein TYRP_021292 [Tyrophagus putrescentiae]